MNIILDISAHRAWRRNGGIVPTGNYGFVSPTSGTVDS